MFRSILVPVDPAEVEFAGKAIETAAAMARQSGGEVVLISVLPSIGGYATEFLPADFEAQAETQARQALAVLADGPALAGIRTAVRVRHGGVYHEVVDDAVAAGTDLIVLSSHRPSMATYLIGSNAARIVRHAPCSVLVVRE